VRCRAISIPLALRVGGAALDRSVDAILAALAGGPFIFNLWPRHPAGHAGRPCRADAQARAGLFGAGEAGYPSGGRKGLEACSSVIAGHSRPKDGVATRAYDPANPSKKINGIRRCRDRAIPD